jgi:hypothetical protein
VSDAELIQQLDGELSRAAQEQLEARLAGAPDAAARCELLRRRSARLSEMLGAIDPAEAQIQASNLSARSTVLQQAGSRPATSWPLQAAAAIALLLGVLFIVPPVRAWMIERARDIGHVLGFDSAEPSRTPVVPQTAPREADVSIDFAVETDTMDVFAAPRAGHIILRRTAASNATAEAVGATGADLMFLPGGLRIEGPDSPDAEYILTLPARAAAIRLRRPDGKRTLHVVPPAGTQTRIDLSRPAFPPPRPDPQD